MTQLRGRKPAVDMMDMAAMPERYLVQDVDKASKAQIRDLAAPERRHAAQFKVFQVDRVIPGTQLMRQLPVPVLPLVGNIGMRLGQTLPSETAMARTRLRTGKGTTCLAQSPQGLF